ncbi:MAG: fibronectin type III domain-containing protein [Chloroflexota bacterium]|nr:fibronectin type III domain-containing protein [Chloroflexota bacterium]MDE2941344.1 fibronectin type III domain-containing protein [Chloroflexota bacterium]MDE3267443.1 fibronectin type III domain-containing protein [Chloroflexota bacterium]
MELYVSPVSPTEVEVSWSLGIQDAEGLSLYRDGELLTTLETEDRSIRDTELSPNTRYVYRIVANRPNDSEVADEIAVATLAYPPRISGQMATHWTGFQQPIIDELNPDYTEYRVVLTKRGELTPVADVADSGWSTSRCRKLDGLEPRQLYTISVTARNLDGVETEPARLIEDSPFDRYRSGSTRIHPANESQWAKNRVGDLVDIYGLTDAAEEWMNNDIQIAWARGEPFIGRAYWGKPTVGHRFPGTLMHEVMHVFWHFWDGFPEPCDRMNRYTFRRDVAQFVLDFRDYLRSDFSTPFPWESWRLYYDMLVGLLEAASPDNEDSWEILERQEYTKLWGGFFHRMEANILNHIQRTPSLLPPTIRRYFEGFIEPGENITWEQHLSWYSRLAEEDRHLATRYRTHDIASYVEEFRADPGGPRTRFPEPLRTTLREADRQMLVDFINALEDIKPREEWTPWFWSYNVRQYLYRLSLYGAEMDSSVGIELEEANLEAVLATLRALYDHNCPQGCWSNAISRTSREDVHQLIASLENLSDTQRRVLRDMTEIEPP